MEVELPWAGDFISRHTLLRSVQTYKELSNFDELVARMDVLRIAGHSLLAIAGKLNEKLFRDVRQIQGDGQLQVRSIGVRIGC